MHVAHTFVVAPKISLKARRSSCVLTTSALNMKIDTLNMKIEPPRQDIDLLRRKVGHAVAIAVATSLIALVSTPMQTLAESLPPGESVSRKFINCLPERNRCSSSHYTKYKYYSTTFCTTAPVSTLDLYILYKIIARF